MPYSYSVLAASYPHHRSAALRQLWVLFVVFSLGCGCASDAEQDGLAPALTPGVAPSLMAGVTPCVDTQSDSLHCGVCGNQCAAGSSCQAGVCVAGCRPDQVLCDDSCASISSDPNNCGACNATCGAGGACIEGSCGCAAGQVACGESCAELSSDAANCGGCGIACGDGFVCSGGNCVCPTGTTSCGDQCVHTTSNDQNCGACGQECQTGSTCQAGECTCAEGQALCGDECIDVGANVEHCGACGVTCDSGSTCVAGLCRGVDGCTNRPVSDVDISEVAAYQTVKIPLAIRQDNQLQRQDNAVPLIEGKDALLRVFVTPAEGFEARQLSARLMVQSSGVEEPVALFQKQEVSRDSHDLLPDSTFIFELPGEVIAEGLQYQLSVVTCDGEQPAQAEEQQLGSRFPQEGFQRVDTIETGPIKVHLFPVNEGQGAPDIPQEMQDEWRGRLLATFPNSSVELTIRNPIRSEGNGMCAHVVTLRDLRMAENPPTDQYWYGVTNGAIGAAFGCSLRSPNVRSPLGRLSAGLARTQSGGYRRGSSTFAHELGHAAGRLHVNCGGATNPDPNYPFSAGRTGSWGYDFRDGAFLPPTTKDMMSYCPLDRVEAWASAYTYENLLRRQRELFELGQQDVYFGSAGAEEPVGWRVLKDLGDPPSWADNLLMVRGTPDGEPQSAIVSDASGYALATITLYKEELHDTTGVHKHVFTVPTPGAGWHTLHVAGLPPVPF